MLDELRAATDRLLVLTQRWTAFEDVPKSQQYECRRIGKTLHNIGGMKAMTDAFYQAKAQNRAASVCAAYWDGIGDWMW